MKSIFASLIVSSAFLLSSCADYSNSAVNSRRGQSSALVSDSELRQHRAQRTDQLEDAQTGRQLSALQRDQVLDPLRDASQATSILRSFGR